MSERTIISTTKVSDSWRISLVEAVREEFAARGTPVEEGDRVVYKKRGEDVVVDTARVEPDEGRDDTDDSDGIV